MEHRIQQTMEKEMETGLCGILGTLGGYVEVYEL